MDQCFYRWLHITWKGFRATIFNVALKYERYVHVGILEMGKGMVDQPMCKPVLNIINKFTSTMAIEKPYMQGWVVMNHVASKALGRW